MPEAFNPAAWMLPIFTVAIAIEWWVTRKADNYHVTTALSDLGTGGVFQGLELLLHFALLPAYHWLFTHASVTSWADGSPWMWAVALIGVDLLFYWWHRLSHVVHALWAVHGVHHQSEDFNLAVALRQPAFEPLTWFPFAACIALLGVPLYVYLISYGLNRFYQFWVHTELVDRLGPLELVLNTPSHHRVHHAVQEQYLDRNYGGVLIIWDRLFGTFEREQERPLYGTTVPLRSANPVWGNFKIFADIVTRAGQGTSLKHTWHAWFGHPAWQPPGAPAYTGAKRTDDGYEKYRPSPTRSGLLYIALHFAIIGGLTSPLLEAEPTLGVLEVVLAAGALILGQLTLCAVAERRAWAVPVDALRWAMLIAALALALPTTMPSAPLLWPLAALATLGFLSQIALWRRP